jgi:CRISPR-associated endonuclease/helicase Cas3
MRMLFSCLVDADYLDTERFMRPDIYALRSNYLSLSELKKRFDNFMSEMTRNAPQTRMNRIRSSILQTCIEKGRGEPGFYSLTVPTGGGKTLAVAAFGLEHAKANHMDQDHNGCSIYQHH